MRQKLSRNATTSIASALLLSMLSSGTCEQATLSLELCQISNGHESDCPVTNAKQYAILFGGSERQRTDYFHKNPKHELPIFLLFFRQPDHIHVRHPPRIYTAIWEDGMVVWGACKGAKLVANDIQNDNLEIQYFQSTVDSNKVKKLIANLVESSVWTGDLPLTFGIGKTQLMLRYTEKVYSMTADGIDVSYNPLFYGIRAY